MLSTRFAFVRYRAVEQLAWDAFLAASTAFYTSLESIFSLKGLEAFGPLRFTAPRGRRICGLRFEGSTIDSVTARPEDGDMRARKTRSLLS